MVEMVEAMCAASLTLRPDISQYKSINQSGEIAMEHKIESAPEIERMVSEGEISAMFGISVTCLQKDRTQKSLTNKTNKFSFVKIGNTVRYFPTQFAVEVRNMTIPAAPVQPPQPYRKPERVEHAPGAVIKRGRGRPRGSANRPTAEGE